MSEVTDICENVEYVLESQKRRHLIGGVLLSFALLFGGLAVTTMTLKESETKSNE